MRLALVNMPFGSIYRPSIGLSLLKSGLKEHGVESDIYYLNLKFAEQISLEMYDHISEGNTFSSNALAGEIIFSESLFGIDTFDSYVKEAKIRLGNSDEDFQIIHDLIPEVEPFLESCLTDIDWAAYEVIGFTSVFEQNVAAISLANRLKKRYPEKFIIFGGANCEETMGIELLNQFRFIDAVCLGEGDISFVSFISEMNETNQVPKTQGILLQEDARFLDTGTQVMSPSITNMDQLPYPDYKDYFDQFTDYSFKDRVGNTRFLYESSRGCWWGQKHHCVFCGLNGSNLNFRSKSEERAFDELIFLTEKYKEYTSKAAAVDNIIDMKYFHTLLPALKEQRLDLDMFYETKANLKKEQIKLFREAGFKTIQPGIESLLSSVLKLMNKGVTVLQNVQLLKWAKEYEVFPAWNILYGFPNEDPDEYKALPDLVKKLTHLTPPGGVSSIRLDRFSPYFDNYKQSGIASIRAMWPYKYIYSKLDKTALDRLAYHFDFDYVEPRNPQEYTRGLRKAIQSWRQIHSKSDLFYVDNGKELLIVDTRFENDLEVHVLKGVQRELYLAFDSIKNISNAQKEMNDKGFAIGLDEVTLIVQEFVHKSLVIKEQSRFLGLALDCKIYSPKKSTLIRLSQWRDSQPSKESILT